MKHAMTGKEPHKVHFTYVDANAGSVSIAGTFNDWNKETNHLKKNSDGRWEIELKLAPGRREYLFCVDDTWTCDPNARETVPNPYGTCNSVSIVT